MKLTLLIFFSFLLFSCSTDYSVKPSMGIQIFDKKQSVIYVPDNDNESKAKGATVGRHLEKAKKHCSKYNKYAELLESNNIMKPYYEIYECKKFN